MVCNIIQITSPLSNRSSSSSSSRGENQEEEEGEKGYEVFSVIRFSVQSVRFTNVSGTDKKTRLYLLDFEFLFVLYLTPPLLCP
ncbi:hypothetical protein CsatB_025430 [Cannabis sativa]|jgi:hypothetical protein